MDVFPTLCELAGLPIPEHLDGVSLAPVMKNPSASVKAVAISQFPRNIGDQQEAMGYAFRDTRYRYIEWVKMNYRKGERDGAVIARELYDYEKDPLETRNLADDPAYAETLAAMTGKAVTVNRSGQPVAAAAEAN